MTTDKLSNDPVLAHFDYIRDCIDKRWFKGKWSSRGQLMRDNTWMESGNDRAHCLVTPGYARKYEGCRSQTETIMNILSESQGNEGAVTFNNAPKTTKPDIFTFLDECKRIRVAELLEAVVT